MPESTETKAEKLKSSVDQWQAALENQGKSQ